MTRTVEHIEDNRIAAEDLPAPASLKVIRRSDPNYGLSEDEIQDRHEFINCYMLQEFELLMMIPKQAQGNEFFMCDCTVEDAEYSAFNTHDFQDAQKPFNKYAYAVRKTLERVKELAVMHSCISQPENRKLMFDRFKSFMAFKFIDRVEELARDLHTDISKAAQAQIKREIAKIGRSVQQCKAIWEQHAAPEIQASPADARFAPDVVRPLVAVAQRAQSELR
jgi:hypothetical protein